MRNPAKSARNIKTVLLGTMDPDDTADFRAVAEAQTIRKHPDWGCQNWVLNVLISLDNASLIEARESGFRTLKRDKEYTWLDPDKPHVDTPVPTDDEEEDDSDEEEEEEEEDDGDDNDDTESESEDEEESDDEAATHQASSRRYPIRQR